MKGSHQIVSYHAANCALCDERLVRGTSVRAGGMHLFGPRGMATSRCWLCNGCRLSPDGLSTTSARFAERVLAWYRANLSVWPSLRLSPNG